MYMYYKDHKESDKNSAIFKHIYNCKSCRNTNIHDNFKVLKRCNLHNRYSLKSIIIEEENSMLNTQITLNGKRTVLTIY